MSSRRCRRPSLAVLMALALAGCQDRRETPPKAGSAPAPLPKIVARPPFAEAGGARTATLSDVAERAVKSVVNISSTRVTSREPGLSPFHGHPFFDRFFREQPREERARSLGSGVIVTRDGVVLTNNHVVQGAAQIRVRLHDGRELAARLVGADPKSDLAVLRLQGEIGDLQPLPFANSGQLRLGEIVLAIGDPFGVGQTVTMGIVSATGRANMGIVDYEDFIQTDAAINPGNSGGALVNMRGELCGINTAILSRTGGYQGIGFAIPSNMARPIMDSLLKHGRVIRGWLGVAIQDLDEEIARALKVPVTRGVLVTEVVAGGPAAAAGLRREDVITHLDGVAVETVSRLRNQVAAAGDKAVLRVKILRGGEARELSVKLSTSPDERTATLAEDQGALGGLVLQPIGEELRRRLGLVRGGVMVKSVEPGSAAQSAGMREGDLILQINRQAVANPVEFAELYRRATGKVLLLVIREGSTMYMLLEK